METNNDLILNTGVNQKFDKEDEFNCLIAQQILQINIEYGFNLLKHVDSDNPKIKKLKEYKEGIEEKFNYLKKPVGLTPQQADLLMSRIPPEDRDAGFDAAILRLRRDTKYLDELEDVGISTALVNGLEKGKYGAYTLFLNPDNFFAKILKNGSASGCYLPILDTVIIPKNPPTSEEMWLRLATEGHLPDFVNTLDHELTHDQQYTKLQRSAYLTISSIPTATFFASLPHLGGWKSVALQQLLIATSRIATNRIKNDTMLSEIHSFNSSGNSPTSQNSRTINARDVAFHIVDNYRIKNRDYIDAINAYNDIHTLRIMGVNDAEIGKVVSGAKYDEKTQSFPKLVKRIMQEKERWGVTSDDTFNIVRIALISQHELELQYQRHQAEEIAARELQREAGRRVN